MDGWWQTIEWIPFRWRKVWVKFGLVAMRPTILPFNTKRQWNHRRRCPIPRTIGYFAGGMP